MLLLNVYGKRKKEKKLKKQKSDIKQWNFCLNVFAWNFLRKQVTLNNEIILKSQQIFKSEAHNVYIKKLVRLHWEVMMIKDCKLFTELRHIHMDTRTEKACKTKLKYKNKLILMIILMKIKQGIF